ncbi:hypothetical protein [Portibacter marinus]|uniref:hypothetical protein n=1 Tax=Portibacter marinus TaxID=2898660 RepID=UPI001F3413D6|nr:hypothetical protein [Portibacter marinus]
MRALVAFILMSILLTSCLKDLRPQAWKDNSAFREAQYQKGKAILEKYAQVSGQEQWSDIQSYRIYISDVFFGWRGRMKQPYGQRINQFILDFYAKENSGTLLFLNGKKKGMLWGYNEGNTYTKESVNGPIKDVDSKKIKAWIPFYQRFIEMPFRATAADQIYHMGEEKYGLYNYDKVYTAWKTEESEQKLEQYVLWVNQSTGLVDKFQFSSRNQGAVLTGTVIISEQTVYDGVIIPGMFKVYAREGSRQPLHIIRPHNFQVVTRE